MQKILNYGFLSKRKLRKISNNKNFERISKILKETCAIF